MLLVEEILFEDSCWCCDEVAYAAAEEEAIAALAAGIIRGAELGLFGTSSDANSTDRTELAGLSFGCEDDAIAAVP